MSRHFYAMLCTALLATSLLPAAAQHRNLKLHVPSPDWRDQVIYFVLTDRFDDGNPRNNDQGLGEHDARDGNKYSGGDIDGIRRRLDYVQALGATALWLTPPVLNQWHDTTHGFWGYHGYWASHFKRMDPHVGTLADYQSLSDLLHRRGMYLVQDVVVNHTGNFFSYGTGWRADDPTADYRPNTGSRPVARPQQAPFHLNDPRRAEDRRAGIYHWTPDIRDVTVRTEEMNFQTSGLDDLNTENPQVRRALRDSFGYWVREVGVDAFRIDTAYHVPPEFFEDFLHATDPRAPGVAHVARRTGRHDFLAFGEGFGIDPPGQTRYTRKLESYIRGDKGGQGGRQRLAGMLNFPLYAGLVDVFARGRAPAELQRRVQDMVAADARGIDPRRLPSFIDNHDVDRWLAVSGEPAMKQALLALMTLPGIPVLYYGTEQGLVEQRASMFSAGWGSGGRDRFDTQAPLFRYTQAAVALRKAHRGFSRALPQPLQAGGAGPGVLAWRNVHEEQTGIVLFNTADAPRFVDNLDVGLPLARLRRLFDIHADTPAALPPALRADTQGRLHLSLPARSGTVWTVEPAPVGTAPAAALRPQLDALPAQAVEGDFDITGRASPNAKLELIVDGDAARAQQLVTEADGRFSARIDTRRMTDPALLHRLVLRSSGTAADASVSDAASFRVALPWRVLADVSQGQGAVSRGGGPQGGYVYPTHESYTRQMDLRRTRVLSAGGALRIELEMADLTNVWGPANGFDHVAFSIFIELPGRSGGARAMTGQDAELPEGMRWHLRLRAHGWSNALFGPEGVDTRREASADGRSITPAAEVETDAASRTVRFTIPSESLGDPASLSGARVFVSTWDWDGGWRPLAREAGSFTVGGGDSKSPKVWNASPVIQLP